MHQEPGAGCRPGDEVAAGARAGVLVGAAPAFGGATERDQSGAAAEAWCMPEQHVDSPGLRLVPPGSGQAVFVLIEPCPRRCGIGFALAAVDVETNDARAGAGGNADQ